MRCARARWRCARSTAAAPTAVLTHGANPGLVSHFVKQALLNIAGDTGLDGGVADRPRGLGRARRSGSASR